MAHLAKFLSQVHLIKQISYWDLLFVSIDILQLV
jgi:hypothetical protein